MCGRFRGETYCLKTTLNRGFLGSKHKRAGGSQIKWEEDDRCAPISWLSASDWISESAQQGPKLKMQGAQFVVRGGCNLVLLLALMSELLSVLLATGKQPAL